MNGQPISLPLPLNDFAKAYDGPPTDPKVFEEQQKKLQEELQKQAEEARKKLESAAAASRRRRQRRSSNAIDIDENKRRGRRAAPFVIWRALTLSSCMSCAAGSRRCRRARTLRRTCGCRTGLPDVSGSRFCSET